MANLIEAGIIVLGAFLLALGLYLSISNIKILKKESLAQPWYILTGLISFFFLGYAFVAIRFLDVDLLSELTIELIIALVFFFGAIFVILLAFLNKSLFEDIFGLDLTDKEAIDKFTSLFDIEDSLTFEQLGKEFQIKCDTCEKNIDYKLADIVRSHPKLNRGIKIEEVMGSKTYNLFLRHRCNTERREIHLQHDKNFEYRSQKPSRII